MNQDRIDEDREYDTERDYELDQAEDRALAELYEDYRFPTQEEVDV